MDLFKFGRLSQVGFYAAFPLLFKFGLISVKMCHSKNISKNFVDVLALKHNLEFLTEF